MQDVTDVTAAIVINGGKVLIAQRGVGDRLEGKWEFPGGKVKPGETAPACLKREIREEFDIEIEVLDKLGESVYSYENGTIRLIAYICRWTSGTVKLNVHSNIKWVDVAELRSYDLAPADIPLAEKLERRESMKL